MAMQTRPLLTAVAVVELATGLGMLLVPSMVAKLLLGQTLDLEVAVVVARITGVALIAIGLVCWLDRGADSPRALLTGLLAYNAGVPVILAAGYVTQGIEGIGLWPAVILHLVFALWIVVILRVGFAEAGAGRKKVNR